MALPNIANWFTPEENDEQAPEWQVGTIYYDGQGYSPDEVDAFAVQLSKLAAVARARVTDGDERLMATCRLCAGSGWVCEQHGIHPSVTTSSHPNACDAGPGAPCERCHPDGRPPNDDIIAHCSVRARF